MGLEWKSLNGRFVAGSLLWMIGLALPSVLTVDTFGIYQFIAVSVMSNDSGMLVIAAFFLVLLNSLRALPIYVGTFLICSSLFRRKLYFRLTVPVLIVTAYFLISHLYEIRYDFSYPSVLVILIIYLLDGFNLYNVTIIKHAVVLIFALIGAQFLDMFPALTPYGFGRGIVSMDIKTAASLIDHHNVLTIFSVAIMTVFLFMALLLSVLLRDQHKLLITAKQLSDAKLHSLEARRNAEIRSLVHDLKTPLTAIQGLAGVIAIVSREEKTRDYAARIESSVDSVSQMISQILYEDQKVVITVAELLDYIRFQIVSPETRGVLAIHDKVPDAQISVNKVLFSRALINLIDNAQAALDKDNGQIVLQTDREGGCVLFTVSDNGKGMGEDTLSKIWDIGFSDKGSTGIGLSFVKSIVENSDGTIAISSQEGKGTTVTIQIKEVL